MIADSYWRALGIPPPAPEFRFHPVRKWRFDYAWPDRKIAVEIEGGAWKYGRHNRASGFIGDLEKYNVATEAGWRVLRYPPQAIDFAQIRRVLDCGSRFG